MQTTTVTTLEHLSSDQYDAGVGELTKLIGDEANRPEWFRRLVLNTDGVWLLSYREARSTLARDAFDDPDRWLRSDLAYDTKLVPLEDGVAILRKEHNADREVARRQERWREHQAAREQRRKDEAAASVDRAQREKEYRARRPERWAALSHEVRVFYVAAAEPAPGSHHRGAMLLLAKLFSTNPTELLNRSPPPTFDPENA